MKKIIVDTNALMGFAAFNLDVFSAIREALDFPYKIFILKGTVEELFKIQREQQGKDKRAAMLALQIIKVKAIPLISEEGFVDNLLVEHSVKGDFILTQDIALKRRLQKPYLTIRQKKKVILVR
jgi:rRNA-processing protein FCF1